MNLIMIPIRGRDCRLFEWSRQISPKGKQIFNLKRMKCKEDKRKLPTKHRKLSWKKGNYKQSKQNFRSKRKWTKTNKKNFRNKRKWTKTNKKNSLLKEISSLKPPQSLSNKFKSLVAPNSSYLAKWFPQYINPAKSWSI